MSSLLTVLRGLLASASARRRHGDVATRRRNTGKVAGLKKNAGLLLMVNLWARGGGRPLTAPPAWGQDSLAMCACSRENNQAPNLATLLQGTASTPAVVIDSSPSPGGRGHGRAPDPTRRPPRAPRIDAGQRHDLARGRAPRAPCPGEPAAGAAADAQGPERPCRRLRRRRGQGREVAVTIHRTRGRMARPDDGWRGRRRGRPTRPLSGSRNGGGTQNGPTRRADTRAGNQRYRIAVQGVAADPSA